MKRAVILLAAAFCITLISSKASAQVPITYYDFENNTTRTTFENAVEQQINSGNSTLTKVGLTTTITGATGAGIALHNTTGATAGTAINATTWSSVTTDPGTAATTYYQFTVNTTGFAGTRLSFDELAGTTDASFPCTGALISTTGAGGPYSVLIAGSCGTNNTWRIKSVALPAAADNNANVVIRVYGYFSDGTTAGVLRLDNITAFATTLNTGSKTLLNEDNIFTSVTSGATGSNFNRGNFTINSGATAILSSFIAIGAGSTFTVASGGTLNFGSVFNAIFSAGNFALNSGGNILINSANGITSAANSGNVQVTGTRTFDPAANYTYNRNGAGAQVTGNQLPTTLTGNLTVALGALADSPLTLTQSMTQGGTGASLTLTSGTFSIGANTLTLNGSVSNASTLSGGTGTVIVGGSISRTFSGAGNYNLNNFQITPAGSLTLNLSSNVTVHVAGNFTKNAGTSLTCNGTATATSNTCTLDFNGGATSSFSWVNATIIPWNITVQTGTTVNVDATNSSFTLRGNLGGGGVFTATTGTITINTVTTSTLAGTKTFNNLTTATGVNFSSGTHTINGIYQYDAGGFSSGSPNYGNASTLRYNTGGTYGRNGEWLPNVTANPGYPNNVQISNTTTLNLPNGSTGSPFQMAGNLTIDVGSTMQMAPLTQPLTVLGSVNINGNLNLSTASGGDIKVGGNWTRGGTYNPNGRAVFFIGSTAQVVRVLSGGSETFNYLIVDKPGADLIINNVAPANDILVNATAGDVLQILGAGGIDLNGRSLVMQNDGGNILVAGGVRNVTGASGSNFEFTGSKTVVSASGGTLVFGTGVNVRLQDSVNFGASLSTINGNLFLHSGGAVNTNPPTYGSTSTLVYDCNCVYGRSAEWSATSGAGYPNNVQVNSGTDVNIGNTTPATPRQIAGTLNAKSGGRFLMDHPSLPMTAALTVLGNVLIESGGSLNLSTAIGGDLHLQGDFTNDGTFVSNNRAVFFEGVATQAINAAGGSLSLPYIRINKGGGTVFLGNTDVNALAPAGGNSIEFAGATSTLTLNGRTLTLGSTVGTAPAGSGFFGDASADLSLQDGGTTGAMGTLVFVAGGRTLENLTINRTGGAGSATLGSDLLLTAALNLTAGDILTGAFTLTHNGTSTGTTDVVGNVRRTDLGTTARQFGNPNNQISFQTGTAPTEMTVNLVKSRPTGAGFGFPNAVNRTYTITPTGGSNFTATLRLHYNDSDLSGTPPVVEESLLDLWRFNGTSWNRIPKTQADPITGNWIESSLVTQFSPWTLSANPLAPTVAKLRSFNAVNYGGVTVLEWQTRYELDNLGFNVYRELGGKRTRITPSLIAGSALLVGSKTALTAGNSYTWIDRTASPAARYWVEDIDLNGKSVMNGPVAPSAGNASDAHAVRHQALLLTELGAEADNARGTQRQWMTSDAAARERTDESSPATTSQSAGISPQLEALEQQRILAAQASVKIAVRGRGWRRISRAELVAAGLSPSADPVRLQMFVNGVELPIHVDDAQWRQGAGTVEFYGEGLDRTSTDTQTYWLVEGALPGKRIPQVRSNGGRPPRAVIGARGVPVSIGTTGTTAPSAAANFDYTVERRDRTIYFSSLLNGEEENFFGRPVTPSGVTQTINVRHLDASSERAAQLRVGLQGVTAAAHQVRALLNGVEIGTLNFDGRTRHEAAFNVAPSLLREGDNDVRLVALGGSSDTSLTDYIRLSYAHLYRAEGDALRVPVTSGSALNLGGFTSPNIRVMDITDPADLAELGATVRAEEDGTFVAAVPARTFTGAARTLFAFADTSATPVDSVAANQPSSWHTNEHGADLVIITHAAFRASVAPLIAARTAEGMSVEVVDVEDIYDEWSYGAHSPLAIRQFLAGARDNWESAPRYVLLVGDGSFDPRNHLKRGAWDLVPAKLVDTTLMETASDGWLADFDDDGLPEMSVGRLPVRTTAEAARVVQKIAGHQFSQTQSSAVLVSDRAGADGYDFEAASNSVAPFLPESVAVERVNRGTRAAEDVRGEIVARVNAGPLVVNWMGHGSIDVWTGDGLLRSQDAAALANGNRLPLFVMMTCLNGYYQDPLLESLAEALLKAEQGGALAVWTSTGMTEPEGQVQMNRELYRVLFGGEGLRLGDAMQRAKSATGDPDVRRTWVLIGDPTTRLR